MPKITKITHKSDKGRYWIYIDGNYCTSIRERTFPAMNLQIGQQISCAEIEELEKHHWKHAYGQPAWDKEKIRLNKVKSLIEGLDNRAEVHIVGFGATSNQFIEGHPSESGKPDLEVRTKSGAAVVLFVEVTGTEFMRGSTYWVRPDKLNYAKNHPEEDVWLILHYAQPVEKFVFIKPNLTSTYITSQKLINDSTELYVEFSDRSEEVVTEAIFANHLQTRLDN